MGNSSDAQFIESIRRYCLRQLENEDLSTEAICTFFNISKSHLHRKIKKATGLSTSLFIRKIRLEKSKEYLAESNKNISEIAYSVGINSPQNFSRYFAEQYGLSPKAFRNQNRIEELSEYTTPVSDDIPWKRYFHIESKAARQLWMYAFFLMLSIGGSYALIRLSPPPAKPTLNQASNQYVPMEYTNSVAVLPFVNLGDSDSHLLADGVMEDILTSLSFFKDLKVISRTSSMHFRNSSKSIKDIAEELGVAYVVEGSVRKHDENIRITAQLIRGSDDSHVWAENYNRPIEEILTIQSEVSKEIARALNQNITQDVLVKLDKTSTRNPKAYNEVLIGNQLIKSRTKEDLQQGIRRFDKAIKLDPDFADAFAFKASALELMGNMYYMNKDTAYDEAEKLALKALELDFTNDHAYSTLANVYVNQYKWKQAESSFQIALQHNPNNARTLYWYSLVLRSMGEIDKAIEFNKKARVLDPLHPVLFGGYVATCLYGGRTDLAKEALMQDSSVFLDEFMYYWVSGMFYENIGECQNAIEQYDKALLRNPGARSVLVAKLNCLGKLGDAQSVHDYMATLPENSPYTHHTKAVLLKSIGQFEEGLIHLIKAAEEGFMAMDIMVDPTYEDFVEDPRLSKSLKTYGFKQ